MLSAAWAGLSCLGSHKAATEVMLACGLPRGSAKEGPLLTGRRTSLPAEGQRALCPCVLLALGPCRVLSGPGPREHTRGQPATRQLPAPKPARTRGREDIAIHVTAHVAPSPMAGHSHVMIRGGWGPQGEERSSAPWRLSTTQSGGCFLRRLAQRPPFAVRVRGAAFYDSPADESFEHRFGERDTI